VTNYTTGPSTNPAVAALRDTMGRVPLVAPPGTLRADHSPVRRSVAGVLSRSIRCGSTSRSRTSKTLPKINARIPYGSSPVTETE
jgi:hypothetical protein